MNLINVFTREEPIAGLEISETYLRLAILGLKVEEALTNGVSKTESLKNLLKKSKTKVRYVIVSVPADNSYSRIFSFPKSLAGEKLEETMKLTVGFQLPVKLEDIYLDWEKVETKDKEKNEIFLAAMPKTTINDYINVLNAAELKPVAIELHPQSFLRVMDLENDKTVLVKMMSKTSVGIFIIKNRVLRFSRILPENFLDEAKLELEVRKITDFYESENGPIAQSIKFGEPDKWLISTGAATRGLLPRSKDTLISLMPIGTEQAYEFQKAVAFIEFLSSLAVGFAIFFSAAFLAIWLLIVSVQQQTLNQLEILSSLPLPQDTVELENKALKFNTLVNFSSDIIKTLPRWSFVIEELRLKTLPAISLTNVSLSSTSETINIIGIAKDRDQLNLFKKNLESSTLFREIILPLTNLEQEENIPFSISFKLKEPQKLYVY